MNCFEVGSSLDGKYPVELAFAFAMIFVAVAVAVAAAAVVVDAVAVVELLAAVAAVTQQFREAIQ